MQVEVLQVEDEVGLVQPQGSGGGVLPDQQDRAHGHDPPGQPVGPLAREPHPSEHVAKPAHRRGRRLTGLCRRIG